MAHFVENSPGIGFLNFSTWIRIVDVPLIEIEKTDTFGIWCWRRRSAYHRPLEEQTNLYLSTSVSQLGSPQYAIRKQFWVILLADNQTTLTNGLLWVRWKKKDSAIDHLADGITK